MRTENEKKVVKRSKISLDGTAGTLITYRYEIGFYPVTLGDYGVGVEFDKKSKSGDEKDGERKKSETVIDSGLFLTARRAEKAARIRLHQSGRSVA